MDDHWKYFHKFLFKTATANVYSSPPFAMETILSLIICSIYIFLVVDLVNVSAKTLHLKPNCIYMSSRMRNLASHSNSTSITSVQDRLRNASDFTLNKSTDRRYSVARSTLGNILKDATKNVEDKIENVLKLTPEEYLRQQRQASSRHEFHTCLKSLSSLYEDCVKGEKPEKELQKQLDEAKEFLGGDSIKYLGKNAQYLTQSLFDLLEKMVISSSPENPLPFQGDFTTLVFDAGNLNVVDEDSSSTWFREGKGKEKQS